MISLGLILLLVGLIVAVLVHREGGLILMLVGAVLAIVGYLPNA
jgi:hypothetical protein